MRISYFLIQTSAHIIRGDDYMFEVREMTIADLEETLKVESSAIRGNPGYLADAFHYYQSAKGELSVALKDGKIVGVGKLSILFDGSAWLEVLRAGGTLNPIELAAKAGVSMKDGEALRTAISFVDGLLDQMEALK